MRRITPLVLVLMTTSANADMQTIGSFAIDRTEVTIAEFGRFAAATALVTKGERDGGGLVFEAGWTRKSGWTWKTPFGKAGQPDEPAVHVTFSEAKAYCQWAGKRLPTDREWVEAAYTERRNAPPAPFTKGKTYPFPTGDSPKVLIAWAIAGSCLWSITPPFSHAAAARRALAQHAQALMAFTIWAPMRGSGSIPM